MSDQLWDITAILTVLSAAAEHLLHDHDCNLDTTGHIAEAAKQARLHLEAMGYAQT